MTKLCVVKRTDEHSLEENDRGCSRTFRKAPESSGTTQPLWRHVRASAPKLRAKDAANQNARRPEIEFGSILVKPFGAKFVLKNVLSISIDYSRFG
jgi:hypothetical protein